MKQAGQQQQQQQQQQHHKEEEQQPQQQQLLSISEQTCYDNASSGFAFPSKKG